MFDLLFVGIGSSVEWGKTCYDLPQIDQWSQRKRNQSNSQWPIEQIMMFRDVVNRYVCVTLLGITKLYCNLM